MVGRSIFRDSNGLSRLAQPLATDKVLKKALKLVKKSLKDKSVRRGVKEVQKALRKGQKGICLIAGDITPIDVVSHLPGFCEEKEVPFVFVPCKKDLGEACKSKRPTSCLLITKPSGKGDENKEEIELFEDVFKKINKLDSSKD